jgi:hypothetical protein
MMGEREFLRHVQALVRTEASLKGLTDLRCVRNLANEFLCSYGSAMEMPKIYVAYLVDDTAIEIDVLGPHNVVSKPKRPSRP